MIQTKQLCKVFRGSDNKEIRAVENVTLTIPEGRFAVLTGPSGSGKTTLLSLLGALSRPSSGSVVLEGHDLAMCSDVQLSRIRRNIGFVFQNFSLLPRLPVWENVTYPLIPRGIRSAERHEIAVQLLQRLGIAGKVESRPDQLSGGEQQRVAVARALASQPRILLADEPTSNLDDRTAAELVEVFQAINTTGVTLILSTHNSQLLHLATDIFVMKEGEVTCAPENGASLEQDDC